MRLLHPTDDGRSKDVPDELVEKFLAGGWRRVEVKRAPAKQSTPPAPTAKK